LLYYFRKKDEWSNYFVFRLALLTRSFLKLTAKGDITTNIGLFPKKEKTGLMVFPNPAKENFTINFETESSGFLRIKDLNGSTIDIKKISSSKSIKLHTNNYPSGLYILELRSNSKGKLYYQKLVVR